MEQRLTYISIWMPDDQISRLEDLQFRVQSKYGLHPQFISASLWKDSDLPERYLAVLHETVEVGQVRILDPANDPELAKEAGDFALGLPDVHEMKVVDSFGKAAASIEIGQYLSLSRRTADPGRADDLLSEMSEILYPLRFIEGFLGYAYGEHVSNEEEVFGAVFWGDRKSFDESVPRGSFYEIRLFVRIA
jgi:hypothetical protein